jgi:hypothetical protein
LRPEFISSQSCGYIVRSNQGCLSTTLGPFGHIGGLIEGYAFDYRTEVIRYLYIVDVAAGSNADEVVLYRYQKVDDVIFEYNEMTYKLTKEVAVTSMSGLTTKGLTPSNTFATSRHVQLEDLHDPDPELGVSR